MTRWLEGVQERAQLLVAIIVYLNRFGTLPSLWTVRPGREARVAQVMQVAVRRGSPLRAVPKTQAMTWRSKRLADVNSAASKVIMRDMIVLPS
jgi:hypothetical protein